MLPIKCSSCNAEQNPVFKIFFAAVANNGKVVPYNFINAELIVNTAEYFKILYDFLLAWIYNYYGATKAIQKKLNVALIYIVTLTL